MQHSALLVILVSTAEDHIVSRTRWSWDYMMLHWTSQIHTYAWSDHAITSNKCVVHRLDQNLNMPIIAGCYSNFVAMTQR